jgi:hypothetical protein
VAASVRHDVFSPYEVFYPGVVAFAKKKFGMSAASAQLPMRIGLALKSPRSLTFDGLPEQ